MKIVAALLALLLGEGYMRLKGTTLIEEIKLLINKLFPFAQLSSVNLTGGQQVEEGYIRITDTAPISTFAIVNPTITPIYNTPHLVNPSRPVNTGLTPPHIPHHPPIHRYTPQIGLGGNSYMGY